VESKVILITGASAGIGRATANLLMEKGFCVYGTSRKVKGNIAPDASSDDKNNFLKENIIASDKKSGGFICMIPLDVTEEATIAMAVDLVISKEGRIDILVSNAGNGIAGSIEDVSTEEASMQFDINFFGSLRVIKEALPHMRRQGNGLIIAMSSVAGVISIPYQAHYSASKFALEGLIEALRHEVAPFGIKACLVEPGDTRTEFTGRRTIANAADENSPYYDRFTASLSRMEKDEQNGASPDVVARTVYNVIKRKNPPVRVAVGFQYKLFLFLKKILPSRLCAKVVGMLYS